VNLFDTGCYTPGVGEASTDSPPRGQPASEDAPETDDSALIAGMARGDGAALTTLYDRHGQRLCRYIMQLAGDRGTAEEILQDTLLAAWRSAGEFAGRVRVGEHDLSTGSSRTAVKRTLGYPPQDLGVYPDLSAARFLDYVALLNGIAGRSRRRAKVREVLEFVGLDDVAKRKLKGFSGGMKRRVGIAQALLAEPRLIIVDEPR